MFRISLNTANQRNITDNQGAAPGFFKGVCKIATFLAFSEKGVHIGKSRRVRGFLNGREKLSFLRKRGCHGTCLNAIAVNCNNYRIPDDVLEKDLQHASGLLIDQTLNE